MSLEASQRFYDICENISGLRDVPESLFEEWHLRILDHLAQVRILRKLDEVSKLIREAAALPVRRINFNIKKLSEDHEECKARWLALERLDCPSIIFCTLSLSGLMSLPLRQFDWLAQNVQSYVEKQKFRPNWIARDQIRKALASTPRRQSTQSLLQRYHDLEIKMDQDFTSDITDEPEAKRRRIEAEQSPTTNAQVDASDEFGIIKKLVKERGWEGNAAYIEFMKILFPGEPQTGRLLTAQSRRPEIEFAFSQAPIEKLPLLRDLILKGIESSQLYSEERKRQEPRTGCITVFIRPRNADGSIIITTGSRTCHAMRNALSLDELDLG
ncbi:hypothetical protein F5884DRAFT_814441 [Xylogone sp. PMI_703]|nr:hypothetical protein F5884DRAFT_814441 [Xylogone sp. PMI_703]